MVCPEYIEKLRIGDDLWIEYDLNRLTVIINMLVVWIFRGAPGVTDNRAYDAW